MALTPTQLTNFTGEWFPQCSPTEPWFIYVSEEDGKELAWKMPIAGGDQVRVTNKYTYRPALLPNGKLLAYSYWDEEASPPGFGREVISLETGKTVKKFDLPLSAAGNSQGRVLLRWTPDGRTISYSDTRQGVANIWSLPLEGGQPKQLTNFTEGQIFYFDWLRKSDILACSRGFSTEDVVMIKE